jgi:hypothetical protein
MIVPYDDTMMTPPTNSPLQASEGSPLMKTCLVVAVSIGMVLAIGNLPAQEKAAAKKEFQAGKPISAPPDMARGDVSNPLERIQSADECRCGCLS